MATATLTARVEATGVEATSRALRGLARLAGVAESAVERLRNAAEGATDSINDINRPSASAARALRELGIRADRAEGAVDQLRNELAQLREELGRSRGATSRFTNIISGLKTGIIGATVAMTAYLGITAKSTLEMVQLAKIAGVSVQEFQKISTAFKTVGFTAEDTSEFLKDINDGMGDLVITGGGPFIDVFEKILKPLGKTKEELIRLKSSDVLFLIAEGFDKLGINVAEATFDLESFSGQSTALLPLLENNAKQLRDISSTIVERGLLITNSEVEVLKRANQTLKEMNTSISSFSTKAFASALEKVFGKSSVEDIEQAKEKLAELKLELVRLGKDGDFTELGRVTLQISELTIQIHNSTAALKADTKAIADRAKAEDELLRRGIERRAADLRLQLKAIREKRQLSVDANVAEGVRLAQEIIKKEEAAAKELKRDKERAQERLRIFSTFGNSEIEISEKLRVKRQGLVALDREKGLISQKEFNTASLAIDKEASRAKEEIRLKELADKQKEDEKKAEELARDKERAQERLSLILESNLTEREAIDLDAEERRAKLQEDRENELISQIEFDEAKLQLSRNVLEFRLELEAKNREDELKRLKKLREVDLITKKKFDAAVLKIEANTVATRLKLGLTEREKKIKNLKKEREADRITEQQFQDELLLIKESSSAATIELEKEEKRALSVIIREHEEKELEEQKIAANEQLQLILDSGKTERQKFEENLAKKLKILKDANDKGLLEVKKFQNAITILEADAAKTRREQDNEDIDKKTKATTDFLDGIAVLTSNSNETLFKIGKAAAIASAVVNIAGGITKALNLPFPLNLAAAATVAAAGATQLATLASSRSPGGESGGGGGGGAASDLRSQAAFFERQGSNIQQQESTFGGLGSVQQAAALGETERESIERSGVASIGKLLAEITEAVFDAEVIRDRAFRQRNKINSTFLQSSQAELSRLTEEAKNTEEFRTARDQILADVQNKLAEVDKREQESIDREIEAAADRLREIKRLTATEEELLNDAAQVRFEHLEEDLDRQLISIKEFNKARAIIVEDVNNQLRESFEEERKSAADRLREINRLTATEEELLNDAAQVRFEHLEEDLDRQLISIREFNEARATITEDINNQLTASAERRRDDERREIEAIQRERDRAAAAAQRARQSAEKRLIGIAKLNATKQELVVIKGAETLAGLIKDFEEGAISLREFEFGKVEIRENVASQLSELGGGEESLGEFQKFLVDRLSSEDEINANRLAMEAKINADRLALENEIKTDKFDTEDKINKSKSDTEHEINLSNAAAAIDILSTQIKVANAINAADDAIAIGITDGNADAAIAINTGDALTATKIKGVNVNAATIIDADRKNASDDIANNEIATANTINVAKAGTANNILNSEIATANAINVANATTALAISSLNITTANAINEANATTALNIRNSNVTTVNSINEANAITAFNIRNSNVTTVNAINKANLETAKLINEANATTARNIRNSNVTTVNSINEANATTARNIRNSNVTTVNAINTSNVNTAVNIGNYYMEVAKWINDANVTAARTAVTIRDTATKSSTSLAAFVEAVRGQFSQLRAIHRINSPSYGFGFQQGGQFQANDRILVGEQGPELVEFNSGGRIADTRETSRLMRGDSIAPGITIINQTSGEIEEQGITVDDENNITILIRNVVSSDVADSNSSISKSLGRNTTLSRQF